MKTVLTIDPGILNLAMCVMSCSDCKDLKTFCIKLWNVYDVIDAEKHTCNDLLKNGKICDKKCGFKYREKETAKWIYCCKTHFPKINGIKKIDKCNIFKKKLVSEYLLHDIAKTILTKIDEIYIENKKIFEEIDEIVIELQPKLSPKMVFTSHIIYGKFTELYKNTNTKIKFVRASQKLKAYTGPPIICSLKGAYAKRKFLSVKYGYWFLENKFSIEQKNHWLPILKEKKKLVKTDDIFDTLNMSINALHGVPKKQKMNFKKENLT